MTDSTVDWESFDTSPFIKWTAVGEFVEGVVTKVYSGTDFNGNPCPVIDLTTEDGEKVLSCGPANLKAGIVAVKPRVGQTLKVTFSSEQNTGKGNPLKVFTIEVTDPLGMAGANPPVAPMQEPDF